jgi:hypothetical protein
MKLNKPTKEEFEEACVVMEWVREKTEEDEPHAIDFIESCGEMIATCEEYAAMEEE